MVQSIGSRWDEGILPFKLRKELDILQGIKMKFVVDFSRFLPSQIISWAHWSPFLKHYWHPGVENRKKHIWFLWLKHFLLAAVVFEYDHIVFFVVFLYLSVWLDFFHHFCVLSIWPFLARFWYLFKVNRLQLATCIDKKININKIIFAHWTFKCKTKTQA